MSLRAASTPLLNTRRDSDSTTSLGTLFQYPPLWEEVFPNIQPEPMLAWLWTFPKSFLSPGYWVPVFFRAANPKGTCSESAFTHTPLKSDHLSQCWFAPIEKQVAFTLRKMETSGSREGIQNGWNSGGWHQRGQGQQEGTDKRIFWRKIRWGQAFCKVLTGQAWQERKQWDNLHSMKENNEISTTAIFFSLSWEEEK